MGQPVNLPVSDPPPFRDPTRGFCPACGEPEVNDRINHDFDCPYRGDDLPPEESNY